MSRLLYENSVSYKGYLIIPFVFQKIDGYDVYSYKLLSEIQHRSQFHKSDNPSGIYGSSIVNIVEIAQEHLDSNLEFVSQGDCFQSRYIYRNNLILIFAEGNKYYYDHYSPESLNNIAAPKVFTSTYQCINWIKQGLDGVNVRRKMWDSVNKN